MNQRLLPLMNLKNFNMANPFETQFDSECQECGESVEEEDIMFADDCEDCAYIREVVCSCGKYKREEYEKCYSCFKQL